MARSHVRQLLLQRLKVLLRLPIPDAVGREEQINLLERALVRLGVQRPNHGDRDSVACGEDVERLLAERVEHYGAEECEPAVANGPADDAPGIALCAHFEGEDLGGVEPRDGEPGRAEDGREDEDHGDGGVSV